MLLIVECVPLSILLNKQTIYSRVNTFNTLQWKTQPVYRNIDLSQTVLGISLDTGLALECTCVTIKITGIHFERASPFLAFVSWPLNIIVCGLRLGLLMTIFITAGERK